MKQFLAAMLLYSLTACASDANDLPFQTTAVASFEKPWAMAFLPDGRLLITEKPGRLLIVTQDGKKSAPVKGVPDVDYGGQGGFGDVALHPDFANNKRIYLSYVEAGENDTRGALVASATLELGENGGSLGDVKVISRQQPKNTGPGPYRHRLLFFDAG